jgi:D-sedoheptulose 7-phosphate isomerase
VLGLSARRERGGRLFILGVGGGAAHASHAVNDFRRLRLIGSYAPSDNVSELTARTNEDGWDTSYVTG